ncbi:hypothetical protein PIB30_034064 [Stylosanthes scabra]|uniref:TF-B3 domain-containing protein n=1 Tax=Stylosanthes scabra TaxID=79078 RepID=A0ABU6ZC01_9FABA|nr:hypothetical protein [Stylosanthes scabra]
MASSASQQNNHSPSTVIRFFKIVLQKSLQDGTLKVPKKFSKKYGDDLPNPVYLKPPDGNEWKIDWTKQDGEVLFEKGWKEFAKYYSLDNGHLLWFEYNGTSEIKVHILDPSCLEIDYPSNDNSVGISKKQQRLKEKVKAEPEPSSPSRGKRLKRTTETTDEEGSLDTQNWKQNDNNKEDRQSEEAQLMMPTKRCNVDVFCPGTMGFQALIEAKKFKSENPSFIVKATKANISTSRPTFQASFYKKHFKDDEQHIQIRFERELFPAKVLSYRSHAFITAGWRLFTRRSKLQPGDVTLFELVNREDPLFDVHIYRAHEQALEIRTGGFRPQIESRKFSSENPFS